MENYDKHDGRTKQNIGPDNYNEKLNIRCRVIRRSHCGFEVLTEKECKTLIGFGFFDGGLSKYDHPYGEKEWLFDSTPQTTIADLCEEAYRQFGISLEIPRKYDEECIGCGPDFIVEIGNEAFLSFEDYQINIEDIVKRFHLLKINAFLFPTFGYGEVLRGKGYSFRFFIRPRESKQHHLPHVHVEGKDDRKGTFDIVTGEPLADTTLKKHERTKIKRIIKENQSELFKYWEKLFGGIEIEKIF